MATTKERPPNVSKTKEGRVKTKKRIKRKKPKAVDPRDKPFTILDSPFKTQGDFEDAVEAGAQAQYMPLFNDWSNRRNLETSSHTGRVNDITAMYNTGTAARQKAIENTGAALNNLITLNSGLSGATRDAMAAALRGSQDTADAAARELGVAGTPVDQGRLNALGAATDVSGVGTTGNFASILGGLGRDVGISEIGRQEAIRNEGSRWDAVLDALTKERTGIDSQLAGFRETSRQNIMTGELARNAQATQQDLAERQFGEQEKMGASQRSIARAQQRESERSNKANEGIQGRQQTETERSNRANEAINRDQIAAGKEEIKDQIRNAKDEQERANLQVKAQRFDKGVKIITDYFKPTKGETAKSGKTRKAYEQRVTHGYDAMVSQLMSATGAGPVEARQMILAAVNPGTPYGKRWVARANREIRTIKADRIKKRSGVDPRNPTGSPMGPK